MNVRQMTKKELFKYIEKHAGPQGDKDPVLMSVCREYLARGAEARKQNLIKGM